MIKKFRGAAFAMLISIILAAAPAILLVQGQIQATPAEQLVELAERAGQHVQNLIDMVNADEEALTQIETVGLTEQFEGNVTLYETDGLNKLTEAQNALVSFEYDVAVDSAIEALRIFREVYSSIHVILEVADLQKGHLIENQGLLEAITRELQRIDRLRDTLPDDAPQEIFELLDDAEESLNQAKTLLLDGDETAAKSAFLDAKESISQVYQYLKAQAEESNTWRLFNYCIGAQERIRERFRYGRDQGIDFTSVLQSYGYQSESQFMETLQNMIQTVQEEQNFGDAVQICEEIRQMIQQMEQALNQEINRQQGQYGFGSGYGYGSDGGGP